MLHPSSPLGMTEKGIGMTEEGVGMTEEGVGMTVMVSISAPLDINSVEPDGSQSC